MNKYVDDSLAGKLVEFLVGIVNDTSMDNDKIAKTLRFIIVDMFEKACFEEKFVRLYPQSLLKFIELMNGKPEIESKCVQAMFQFATKHGKDEEYKNDLEPIIKFMNEYQNKINEESI